MNTTIRMATLKDVPFIRALAVESAIYGIPSTRKIDPDTVRKGARKAMEDLEFMIHNRHMAIIVAEDTDIKKPVGYLMLVLNAVEESTGEPQSFIHDIAVKREYWGKFVTDRLMAKAEDITKEHDLPYITANISDSNRRSHVYATKRLGYTIERHQIVKVLM